MEIIFVVFVVVNSYFLVDNIRKKQYKSAALSGAAVLVCTWALFT